MSLPSLAQRPIETRFAVVETTPLPPPGPAPAELSARLTSWRAQALSADAAFAAALPGTQQAVAAAEGSAIASEAWILGQQALSRLATARGPVGEALADADALFIERQTAEQYDGLPDIAALRAALAAMIAAQDRQLEALAAGLPQ